MSTRRRFLSALAVPGLLMTASPVARAFTSMAPFAPGPQDDDAAVFAAAREHFLIPRGRCLLQYRHARRIAARSRGRADRRHSPPRNRSRGLAVRTARRRAADRLPAVARDTPRGGAFVNASAAEIALTQNATMGMNFLANGLDLAAGDEVVSTDQEHGGGHLAVATAREAPRRSSSRNCRSSRRSRTGRTRSCGCSRPR